jgi:hypothetical protein
VTLRKYARPYVRSYGATKVMGRVMMLKPKPSGSPTALWPTGPY